MPRSIAGARPTRRMTGIIGGCLLVFGGLLGMLESSLPLIEFPGTRIVANRLVPLVLLVLVVPVLLPLAHLRHPRPHWFWPVLWQVLAGLVGYIVVFQVMNQGLLHFFDQLDLPSLAISSLLWVIGCGVAAGSISAVHMFRRPQLDFPQCPACDYSLQGVKSDRCPECGRQIDGVEQS